MDLAASAATAAATTSATAAGVPSTTAAAAGRVGQRNNTHRTVNVHGRLMYDEIVINDVWINAILSTLALACAACLCLCFLYCKFQQWKHAARQRRDEKNSRTYDDDSLPSYTIVTGLPTYDEAVERMKPPPPPPPPASDGGDGGDGGKRSSAAEGRAATVSVVAVDEDEARDHRFGLVSHSLFAHDGGCSHCLSVQELLETYDVR